MKRTNHPPEVDWMIDVVKEKGAAECGALSYGAIEPFMDKRAKGRMVRIFPQAKGVLIGAFPYFAGAEEGNLSLYARGLDYHLALSRRLEAACQTLNARFPAYGFVPGVDASPVPERAAALLAGIGIRGEHGLVICPPYGSYVFLGSILTDYPISFSGGTVNSCAGCLACVKACPAGALHLGENGDVQFDSSRCLSHVTQKKKNLTEEEQMQLNRHPYLWGCDLCQLACPENRGVPHTPLLELAGQTREAPYLSSLTPEMLEGLEEETFQTRFGCRAFAWRGLGVLRRNMDLKYRKE